MNLLPIYGLLTSDNIVSEHEWAWDEQVTTAATLLSKQNREVRFHPGYSSGTAAVRGNSPFLKGHVYYWEIKMLTALYGTDVVSICMFIYYYLKLQQPLLIN